MPAEAGCQVRTPYPGRSGPGAGTVARDENVRRLRAGQHNLLAFRYTFQYDGSMIQNKAIFGEEILTSIKFEVLVLECWSYKEFFSQR